MNQKRERVKINNFAPLDFLLFDIENHMEFYKDYPSQVYIIQYANFINKL